MLDERNQQERSLLHIWRRLDSGRFDHAGGYENYEEASEVTGRAVVTMAGVRDRNLIVGDGYMVTSTFTPPDVQYKDSSVTMEINTTDPVSSPAAEQPTGLATEDLRTISSEVDGEGGWVWVWKDGANFLESPYPNATAAAAAIGLRDISEISNRIDTGYPLLPHK